MKIFLNPVASRYPAACRGVSERMGNIIIPYGSKILRSLLRRASNHREPHEPQDVAAQDEQLADDVPIFPPNLDINFSAFFDLHAGHDTLRCSLLDLNKISKIFLHFLHLNS